MSDYLFATCQIGAEDALKDEVRESHSAARLAFSRPGFLTFKTDASLDPTPPLDGVFARCWGVGCGRAATLTEAIDLARAAASERGLEAASAAVQAWARDAHAPGEEPQGHDPLARHRAIQSEVTSSPGPSSGLVLDAIEVEPGQWWAGFHRPGPNHRPFPGGIADLTLPREAPSRSYLKILEAERLFGVPLRPRDVALELGSAPGGACLALLERGLRVVGVDPAPMDPVTRKPDFTHIAESAMTLPVEMRIPTRVSWLLLDMNCNAPTALRAAKRFAGHVSPSLLGVLLTLKVNEWSKVAGLPEWLRIVQSAFGVKPVARQLFHHRQELVVYGLTKIGKDRLRTG